MVHASSMGAPRAWADGAIVAMRHKGLEAISMKWWSWLCCTPHGCSHSRGHWDSISRPEWTLHHARRPLRLMECKAGEEGNICSGPTKSTFCLREAFELHRAPLAYCLSDTAKASTASACSDFYLLYSWIVRRTWARGLRSAALHRTIAS